MKLELAQFRELQAFASFGSDLDKATLAQLERGRRLTELLKQGQFQPLPVEEQVVSIFAGVRGYLDRIKVEDVNRFEKKLLEEIRLKGADVLTTIRNEKALSPATEEKLKAFIGEFAKVFV